MGLKEKRATKDFVENKFDGLKASINEIAGFEIELDVHWDKLAEEGKSHLYEDCWTKVYFQPLMNAFKDICQDDMGREALQEGLKKIVITNDLDNQVYSGNSWSTFADGVITLNHSPITNVDNIEERAKYLLKNIEAAL